MKPPAAPAAPAAPATTADPISRALSTLGPPRAGQLVLARAIDDAFRDHHHLVAIGPTGIGKSAAYGAPAALSRGRTLVVSQTKALQGQLANDFGGKFQRFAKFTHAMLKGRRNYACANLAENLLVEPQVRDWFKSSAIGDFEEIDNEDLRKLAQERLSIETDECLKRDCPQRFECKYELAAARANAARVVIVNYAFFFLHLRLRLIADHFSQVVLDEAHELEEQARAAIGVELTEGAFRRLCRLLHKVPKQADDHIRKTGDPSPALREFARHVTDYTAPIADAAERCFRSVVALLPLVGNPLQPDPGPGPFNYPRDRVDSRCLLCALSALAQRLAVVGARYNDDNEPPVFLENLINTTSDLGRRLQKLTTPDDDTTFAYSLQMESRGRGENLRRVPKLVAQPIAVDAYLRDALWPRYPSAVPISATLDPDYDIPTWGLPDDTETVTVPSPFDLDRQARLILPGPEYEIPGDVNSPEFRAALGPLIAEAILLSRGRALVLFTSRANMLAAYRHVSSLDLSFPLLLQDVGVNVRKLKQTFHDQTDSCLFATKSFWTGVDFFGETLSLLIIDKLPYQQPSPLTTAIRLSTFKGNRDRFNAEFRDPRMLRALEQGVGRLIRSPTDRGVIVILDPRARARTYLQIPRRLGFSRVYDSLGAIGEFFA